jgi:hypothetical protein
MEGKMKLWNIALIAVLATWAALATWRLETIPHGVVSWHDAMRSCPMYRAEGAG